MKKTLFAFMALATAFGATSCQSDEELTQPTGKPMVINAVAEGIGTKTRAEMAYKYDILWSASDQIYVKNSANNATFDLQDGVGETSGTFACASSPFTSGDEVEAFYPASLGESLVWPAEQTTSTVIPMYSKQTLGSTGTENFSFASLGAMLQIVFTTPQADVTLKSITLKDGTNPLSGAFTVDEDGMAVMATNTDAPGITLDLGAGVPVGLAAKYFNIAVPAGAYSNLTITFTATNNAVCTLEGSATLTHNTVGRLTLTGKEFKIPFGKGTAKATINGVEKDVKWIQLWENGPKFAEYNVGATSATDCGGYYCWGSNIDKDSNKAYNSGTDALTGNDDTAKNLWGSKWRMPTSEELQALINSSNVQWQWTGSGYKFTGKGDYAANSIFLPAAGNWNGTMVCDPGVYGYYWSSKPSSSTMAYYLGINSAGRNVNNGFCEKGYSVRAVLDETPAPTTGTAKRTGDIDVNWVQLWENGPKFAEYNVGATSENIYGGYYSWGGSQNKVDDHNTTNTGTGNLTGTDDTATKLWGSGWRMPTKAELEALLNSDNCTCTWDPTNKGLLCTGKGDYASNSIFLPAAGWYRDTDMKQGSYGLYWSSTPNGEDKAWLQELNSGFQSVSNYPRGYCSSVRAVLNE